ncbi:hypothetical protein F4780DRAFT_745535 [Xylariomycetidae sp. FL0641]|nr:hypothetical protein F4780DRAFT_745535 [Xylariomycetidae sp. FL0641]
MSSTSGRAISHGVTHQKPAHHYTTSPPTADRVDKRSLEEYRIANFRGQVNSTPYPSSQSAGVLEAAHRTRVANETSAILARFHQK